MAIEETGSVNESLEPLVFVEFANGKSVEFMIDTGFNGSLCLPRSLMRKLGLEKVSEEEISGIGLHQEVIDVAISEIIWFGRKTKIEVLINDGIDRLLGSELLNGKILNINYQNKTLSISDN